MPTSPPLPETVIDPERLEILRELEEATGKPLVAGLIESFLGRTEGEVGAISAALEADDRDALEHAAHRFKGAASNLGAVRVAEVCRRIEKGAPRADREELAAELEALPAETERARRALAAELGDERPG